MPLFGNKFSPKMGVARKSPSLSNLNLDASKKQDFGVEYGPVKLKLGSNEILFADGQWISESTGGTGSRNEVSQLTKENRQIREENNLLKVKVELLLDMLSERTAEVHLQENEIEQLKKMKREKRR